jgi:hypothetical protein
VLLENYIDVVNGLQERPLGGVDGWPQVCAAWRHPSYRELERLRIQMRDAEPFTYWHIAESFFRATFKRVAYCPRCERIAAAEFINSEHRHGQKSITLVPRCHRVVSQAVEPMLVERGIAWLDDRWNGEPFIPDELLAIAA